MLLEGQASIEVKAQVSLVCLELKCRGTDGWEVQLQVQVIMRSREVKDLGLVMLHDQAKKHY